MIVLCCAVLRCVQSIYLDLEIPSYLLVLHVIKFDDWTLCGD